MPFSVLFVLFCFWRISADDVVNMQINVPSSTSQYSFQENFYTPVIFNVTGDISDQVSICINSFLPTPILPDYLGLCEIQYNITKSNINMLNLRSSTYYYNFYSPTAQTFHLLISGNFCLNNQTYINNNCSYPETDAMKIVSLNIGEKQYYRLQLNSTEKNTNTYVYYFNITVIPIHINSTGTLQISLVGRFNGLPTHEINDFITDGSKIIYYPHAGSWEFYVENQNSTSNLTYQLLWEYEYCQPGNSCQQGQPISNDLQVFSLNYNSSTLYIYNSPVSSLTIGATTTPQIAQNISILVGYNRYPQMDDYDLSGCNQLKCSKVYQISIPPLGNPGVWYIVVSNTSPDPMDIYLWFNSPCAPLCTIRGSCTDDATCSCLAQMYSGIDCATLTDHFSTYIPLIIVAGVFILLLILVVILYSTCAPAGYSSIQ